MKIRTGFVSNSSSASFVIAAFKVDSFDEIERSDLWSHNFDLEDGQNKYYSGFDGSGVSLKGSGKFVVLHSYSDEECDEDGYCDFTKENHELIFDFMNKYECKLIDSCTGYGRNG